MQCSYMTHMHPPMMKKNETLAKPLNLDVKLGQHINMNLLLLA